MDDDQSEGIYIKDEGLESQNPHRTKTESEDSSVESEHSSVKESKNQKTFKCFICGKIFTVESACKEHINICIQEGRKDYKCDKCGKLFFLELNFKKHIQFAHGSKEYKKCLGKVHCESCGKTFEKKYLLKRHLRTEHEFNCKFCHKLFADLSSKQKHICIKDDIKCDICGKLLTSKRNLYNHIQKIHAGQKDFQCIHCGMYKCTQNDLRTHVRTIHELEIEDTTNSKTEEDEDIAKPSKRIRLEVEDDFMESSNQEIQNDCFELQPNPFGFTGNSPEINDPLQTIVEPKNILNDHQDDNFKAKTNEIVNDPLNVDIVVKEEPIVVVKEEPIEIASDTNISMNSKLDLGSIKIDEDKSPDVLSFEEKSKHKENKLDYDIFQTIQGETQSKDPLELSKEEEETEKFPKCKNGSENENIVKVISLKTKAPNENIVKVALTMVENEKGHVKFEKTAKIPSENLNEVKDHPEPFHVESHLRKYELPYGWIKTCVQRQNSSGHWDVYLHSPSLGPKAPRVKFRSNPEVTQFLKINPNIPYDPHLTKICRPPDLIGGGKSKSKEQPIVLPLECDEKKERSSRRSNAKINYNEAVLESKNDPLNQIGSESSSDEEYDCEFCEKSFSKEEKLMKHILKIHEGHKDHIQTIHEEILEPNSDPLNQSDDEIEINLPNDWKCDFCGKSFSRKYINKHIRTVHEGQKDHKCKSCGELFTRPESLKRHIHNIHEGRKDYKCELCGRSFSQSGIMKVHMKTHEGQTEIKQYEELIRDWKCEHCSKSYSRADHLRSHIKTVHADQNDFKCDFCEKSFTRADNLRIHVRTVHEENIVYKGRSKTILGKMDKFKIYNCHYCEKSFNYKKTLKNHTANVHGVNIGHHICKFCGKSFSKEHDLIIHKCLQTLNPKIPSSKNNSNSKPETLPNIKKIINTEKENLSDSSSSAIEKTKMDNFENKSMHEDYQCNLCEAKNQKIFTSPQDLMRHHYIFHEGHKCITCGLVFATTKLLNDHNHKLHGYLDNKCYFCFYDYESEEILERHR